MFQGDIYSTLKKMATCSGPKSGLAGFEKNGFCLEGKGSYWTRGRKHADARTKGGLKTLGRSDFQSLWVKLAKKGVRWSVFD